MGTQILTWMESNWLKIIIYIIGALFVMGLIKFISQMFGAGLSDIAKGVADILGAGTNVVKGVVNGCTPQNDCSKQGSTTCNSNGCEWQAGKTSKDPSSCINTTGRKTGSGGLFSSDCVLGMGAIIWLSATVFNFLGPILASVFSKNKNIDKISELTGNSKSEIIKDISTKSIDDAYKAKEEIEKNDKELSKEQQRDLGQKSTTREVRNRTVEAINGNDQMSPQEKKEEIQNAVNNEKETNEENESKSEINEEDAKENNDAVDDINPPEGE